MSFTISAEDPRSIKAIQIASAADSWLRCTRRDGRLLVGVPSQTRDGIFYLVDPEAGTCDCQDSRRNGLSRFRIGQDGIHHQCKHLRAVLLWLELRMAEETLPKKRRPHLTIVPPAVGIRADVFDHFVGD